jgi:thiamine transport system substrate-binding protein
VKGVTLPAVYRHVSIPTTVAQPSMADMAAKQQSWVKQWVKVVQR